MKYKICLLPGDGIGPEVINAAEEVLRAFPLDFEFASAEIGFGEYQRSGSPLPDSTIQEIRHADAALFGAVTTPPNIPNYFSPSCGCAKRWNCMPICVHANQFHMSHRSRALTCSLSARTPKAYILASKDSKMMAIVQLQNELSPAKALKESSAKRLILHRQRERKIVHVVHKANVLRQTCGLFRAVALEIAKEYPDIAMQEMLVDTCAMELVRAPEQFDVIVTTNLFGDILSDEACMFVGGLGVAASGNIGADAAVFEPVHGSAPPLVGTGKANPIATFLATAMMLDYLKENESAERLQKSC